MLMTFHVVHHTDGEWQGKDLVECLCDDLCEHEADEDLERYLGRSLNEGGEDVECQGEEDDGVGCLAYDGGCDGAE